MAEESILPPDWKPKEEGDRVLARLRNICRPQVKGAHGSDFVIADGKAYVVYMANDVQAGENPEWTFISTELSVVDLTTAQIEKKGIFASSEMKYENDSLPFGACFCPRIVRKDDVFLRCFFASQNPHKRPAQTYYIDYDLNHDQFANRIFPAYIETDQGKFPMQPQYLYQHAAAKGFKGKAVMHGLLMVDGFKKIDGKAFAVLNNFPAGQNAWAVLNDTLDCFKVMGDYFQPPEAKLTESAVNRLPDGSWLAISRQENRDGNYMFSSSPNGRHWTPHEYRPFVTHGAKSKPIFECFGGVYYLGWNEKPAAPGVSSRSLFNLDVSRDGMNWERKYIFRTDNSFQYPTFREGNGGIYLSVTQGDHSGSLKERIMFGKLEDL